LKYARRIAAETHRFPDTKRALIELLERWGAGLTEDRTERRMAVRLSQDRLRLVGEDDPENNEIAELPSVRRLAALSSPDSGAGQGATPVQVVASADEDLGGDDDEDEECEAVPADEETAVLVDEDEYYADV